jgi:hypothetical protein
MRLGSIEEPRRERYRGTVKTASQTIAQITMLQSFSPTSTSPPLSAGKGDIPPELGLELTTNARSRARQKESGGRLQIEQDGELSFLTAPAPL